MFFVSGIVLLHSSNAFSELAQRRDISISSGDVSSAWTQPKGRFYHQLYYSYHVSDHKFTTLETATRVVSTDGDVEKVETGKFTAHSITYHGELGIIDSLTIFGRVPWIDTEYDEVARFSDDKGPSGIGDIDIGLRYNLFKNLLDTGVLMSIQGEVKIPEAYDYGNPITTISLGDGQYDATFGFLFGKAWPKGHVLLNTGYTYRFENNEFDPLNFKPSDEMGVLLSGGYFILSKLLLRGSLDWRKSVGNASVSNELVSFALCCNNRNHIEGGTY